MKKTFIEKHDDFKSSVILAIKLAVLKSNTQSNYINENVIIIENEKLQFHLTSNKWITEISHNYLIDCNGYQYDFNIFDLDQLCLLADYCSK